MKFKHLGFVVILFALLSSWNINKPKILIIGDSISIGYTPFVKEALAKKASVYHNPGNAQHTGTGLLKLEEWIGDNNWDIIQFNWGLWDLCYRHPDSKLYGNRDKINGTQTYSTEAYRVNLETLVLKLKSLSRAKLLFVTTSYIPPEEGGRFEEDAQKFNTVAIEVMKKHDIQINTIYKASKKIHLKHGKGNDDVHYTETGYQVLAEIITNGLLKVLKD